MISITPYKKYITALHLFIIIISIVICEDPTTDFDLPTFEDSNNYDNYYFRLRRRYRQTKLEPQEFFKSIYNYWYRALPKPYSLPDYDVYKKMFYDEASKINIEEIAQKCKHYEDHEASSDFPDERYAYEDPHFFEVTDKKYYQSNILKEEYEHAQKFTKRFPEPLGYTEYSNVMTIIELLPKDYESSQDFVKARVGLGKALGELFGNFNPSAKNNVRLQFNENVDYNTEVADVTLTDVYIKGESYGVYAIRMMLQEKVPLDPETFNRVYGTNQSVNDEYAYNPQNTDLKITSDEPTSSTPAKSKSSSRMTM